MKPFKKLRCKPQGTEVFYYVFVGICAYSIIYSDALTWPGGSHTRAIYMRTAFNLGMEASVGGVRTAATGRLVVLRFACRSVALAKPHNLGLACTLLPYAYKGDLQTRSR